MYFLLDNIAPSEYHKVSSACWGGRVEIQKEVVIVDFATGEVCAPHAKKIRRTEPFFMTYQKTAIDVAKKKFSGAELSVLLFLQGKADYDNIAQVSQAFIAKEIGNTEATVSLAIKHLIEEGVITSSQINGRKAFIISYDVSTRGKAK